MFPQSIIDEAINKLQGRNNSGRFVLRSSSDITSNSNEIFNECPVTPKISFSQPSLDVNNISLPPIPPLNPPQQLNYSFDNNLNIYNPQFIDPRQ